MKFKSPTDLPIRIASTSGHVALIGPEWQEIPTSLHHEAILSGCETDQKFKTQESNQGGNTDKSENDLITDALVKMLERDQEDDFTNSGMPNMNIVRGIAGFNASKEDVYGIFGDLKAAAELAAATDNKED